jgi:hypothetical protein
LPPGGVGRNIATRIRKSDAQDGGGRYRSFAAFYPFYLTEHANRTSRRLHVVGTSLVIAALIAGALADWRFFVAAPLVGYGFAWVGHFAFEKNRPATFRYPFYSLAGDFRLWFEVVTGKRPF